MNNLYLLKESNYMGYSDNLNEAIKGCNKNANCDFTLDDYFNGGYYILMMDKQDVIRRMVIVHG